MEEVNLYNLSVFFVFKIAIHRAWLRWALAKERLHTADQSGDGIHPESAYAETFEASIDDFEWKRILQEISSKRTNVPWDPRLTINREKSRYKIKECFEIKDEVVPIIIYA